ncbi:uncharacterized protein LOC134280875 [Saccostrea cucullata]
MSSSTDDEGEPSHLSLEEIQSWKVVELKNWLENHRLKKSGNKEVLAKRVYKAMRHGYDSSEDFIDTDEEIEKTVPVHPSTDSWKELDSTDIPEISHKAIDIYFKCHKNPVTGERLNFERQMKKAKRLCNEGFIREIEYNKGNSDFCYMRSTCLPSMKQTVQVGFGKSAKYYSLNVCIKKKSGIVVNALCNCKAGEAGLCAHVGALLYVLVKTKNSCTSNQCVWNRPTPLRRKPSPKRVGDISFSKTEKDNIVDKVRPFPGIYNPGPCQSECSSFLNDILDGLKDIYPQCVLYQTLRAEHVNIDSFLNIFLPDFMYRDNVNLKSKECVENFKSFVNNMNITTEVSELLEKGTRGQNSNVNWRKARCNIITASVMGDVVKRVKSEPDNLVKKICGYVVVPDCVKSISYGRTNESVALSDYMERHLNLCGDVKIESCGLYVNP